MRIFTTIFAFFAALIGVGFFSMVGIFMVAGSRTNNQDDQADALCGIVFGPIIGIVSAIALSYYVWTH